MFYVNVPIGLAARDDRLAALPNVPGHPVKAPDALGAALVTAGVALLSLGLVEGNDWGWGSARVIAALAVAAMLLAGFVARTAAPPQPAVRSEAVPDPRVHAGRRRWRSRSRSRSARCCCRSCCGCRTSGAGRRSQTGLAFAPGPLMVPLFGLPGHRAADRALRSRARDRRRRQHLRDRRRLVGAARRAAPGLRRAGAAGHAADRRRRRADDADLHGDGRLRAAAAGVRDRLGGGQHAAPGRARGRGLGVRRGGRLAPNAGTRR